MNKKMVDIYPYYHSPEHGSVFRLNETPKPCSIRSVVFFIGIICSPIICLILPLYLRYKVFTNTTIYVSQSNMIHAGGDVSNIFCEAHTLKMNTSFNAYQIVTSPTNFQYKKQTAIREMISLLNDNASSWKFYFSKGSVIDLSICFRYNRNKIITLLTIENNSKRNVISNDTVADRWSAWENKETIEDIAEGQIIQRSTFNLEGTSRTKENSTNFDINTLRLVDKENYLKKIISFWRRKSSRSFKGEAELNKENCSSIEHKINRDGHYTYILQNKRLQSSSLSWKTSLSSSLAKSKIEVNFNITEPIYNYTQSCINKTECNFPVFLLSRNKIIIDRLPNDYLTLERTNQNGGQLGQILILTCEPRGTVYAIFPILLMIILLFCAFI